MQEDHGNWVVRGRVFNPETGVVRQRSKSTILPVKGNNKRKAELLMRDIVNEWTNEANDAIKPESPVFSVYVHKWLDRKRSLRIKANTIKSYTDYIKVHIDPKLGKIPIKSITLLDLDSFYDEYLQTHTVNSSRKVHVVISGAFKEAVRDGVIQNNLH